MNNKTHVSSMGVFIRKKERFYMKQGVIGLFFILFTISTVFTQATNGDAVTVKKLPTGTQINWTKGILIAEGKGVAPSGLTQAQAEVRSFIAARADAQRLLTGAIQGVQVTSETTVKNLELADDSIKTSISGFLKGAVEVRNSGKLEKKTDGSFIAKVSFALNIVGDDSLADIVYPELIDDSTVKPPKSFQSTVAPTPAPAPATIAQPNPARPAISTAVIPSYTGLIIDARATNYSPCMSPKIYGPSGGEVWGTLTVSSSFANDVGIAAFTRRMEDAVKFTDRGGPGQLMIKATKALGTDRCDVSIAEGDGVLILQADSLKPFLKDFKVTFVY